MTWHYIDIKSRYRPRYTHTHTHTRTHARTHARAHFYSIIYNIQRQPKKIRLGIVQAQPTRKMLMQIIYGLATVA